MLRPFQWWPTIRNVVEYQHFRIILLSLLTNDWNSLWYRVRHCFLNAVQTPHLPYMQSWNKPQSQQQGSWLPSWTYRAICLGPWDRVHQALPLQSPYLQTRTGNTWQWFQNESVLIKQQQKTYISPATHAVMKQATVPATSARTATRAMSDFLDGASGPIPPIWIPIEEKLAKPHNAYVAIISERIC